jgi:hypothetical protein
MKEPMTARLSSKSVEKSQAAVCSDNEEGQVSEVLLFS